MPTNGHPLQLVLCSWCCRILSLQGQLDNGIRQILHVWDCGLGHWLPLEELLDRCTNGTLRRLASNTMSQDSSRILASWVGTTSTRGGAVREQVLPQLLA